MKLIVNKSKKYSIKSIADQEKKLKVKTPKEGFFLNLQNNMVTFRC